MKQGKETHMDTHMSGLYMVNHVSVSTEDRIYSCKFDANSCLNEPKIRVVLHFWMSQTHQGLIHVLILSLSKYNFSSILWFQLFEQTGLILWIIAKKCDLLIVLLLFKWKKLYYTYRWKWQLIFHCSVFRWQCCGGAKFFSRWRISPLWRRSNSRTLWGYGIRLRRCSKDFLWWICPSFGICYAGHVLSPVRKRWEDNCSAIGM